MNIDETCNAFFDPNEHTLNFFKAGDGCVNSAYCDVASHEFGHAVDDQFGDILDGGYSEGFGDSLAILITRDSIIGRDFQGKGNHLRDAREIHTWPPADPEVHEVGKIYGGFAWDLTQQLTSKLGSEDKGFATAKQLILARPPSTPRTPPTPSASASSSTARTAPRSSTSWRPRPTRGRSPVPNRREAWTTPAL